VAYVFGVTEIDCLADVEAEAVGRHESRGEFAGVEADVYGGINAVEEVEHKHLAVILGHGHVGVFRLDEVNADDARVLRRDLKGEKGLGEDLLRRKCAEDLVEETYLHRAGGAGAGLAAVFNFVACVEGIVHLFAINGDFVAEASG
jgi:hypothetical protein